MPFNSISRSIPYEVQRIISENWFLPSDKDLCQSCKQTAWKYCIASQPLRLQRHWASYLWNFCAWDLVCISSLGIMQCFKPRIWPSSFDLVPFHAFCSVKSLLNKSSKPLEITKGNFLCLVLFFLVHQVYCYNVLFPAVQTRSVIYNKIT